MTVETTPGRALIVDGDMQMPESAEGSCGLAWTASPQPLKFHTSSHA